MPASKSSAKEGSITAQIPTHRLQLFGLTGIPMVKAGDSLSDLILQALTRAGLKLDSTDILVVAQKIVSKAEDRMVNLAEVKPGEAALKLSRETHKDPRLAELILQESERILRTRIGVAIVEHRLGLVHANAGIDQSNIEHPSTEHALLLPLDPNASAAGLRAELAKATEVAPGVIISDSTGRPWRLGTSPIAIGAAGVATLIDEIGQTDLFGRELNVTLMALGDQLAAAAGLLMGESIAAQPVVLIRGMQALNERQTANDLIRPTGEDLFR